MNSQKVRAKEICKGDLNFNLLDNQNFANVACKSSAGGKRCLEGRKKPLLFKR